VRQIAVKAIIIFMALIIAAILVAPQVDLDPVAPRLEWAACLLMIFLSWLAALTMYSISGLATVPLGAHWFPSSFIPIAPSSPRSSSLRC
jgi:hypothetical protein